MLRLRRLLKGLIALTLLSAAFYYLTTFLRRSSVSNHDRVDTDTSNKDDTDDVTDIGNLSEFLQSKGVGTDRTVFVTIASERYPESMVNFKRGLDKFSLGEDYVVLCLDTPCLKAARSHDIVAFGGYINETDATGNWRYSIASVKLAANLALTEAGYNFIFVDGDVYLTGTRHPLSAMLPLSDPSWDIQFQDNGHSRPSAAWYWSRPTRTAYDFFLRAQRLWNQTHQLEQEIMDVLLDQMMTSTSLSFPVLSLKDHKNTNTFQWEDIYSNSPAIHEMNQETVTIHYTTLSDATKRIAAKHFGHWFNETYYTQPPRLLQAVNIAGTVAEIRQQIDFSVHLAETSGRTFMWPTTVNVQAQLRSRIWKEVPAILVVDVDGIAEKVPWVEGTYLENRRKYNVEDLNFITIRVPRMQSFESSTSITRRCVISTAHIITIDFGG